MTHSSSTWGRKCNLAPGKQHLPAHRLASTQDPHPNPLATVYSPMASQLSRINYSKPTHNSGCLKVYFIFTLQFYVPRTCSSFKYSTGMKSINAHNALN